MPSIRLLLYSLLAVMLGAIARADDGGFLFVTFHEETSPLSEQIYFALSPDGKTWTALNHDKPVLVSTVGEQAVRDAFILRSHDGSKFYLLATDLCFFHHRDWKRNTHAASKSIVIWDSTDLVNWSAPRLVQVAPDDAGCAWAPEAIWDDKTQDYLVFWASSTAADQYGKQRIWASHTKDFAVFDKPFIYIERPTHVIDADIVSANGKYFRFSKNDTNKVIIMEESDDLDGPWQTITNFSLAHLVGYEAPECFQLAPAANGAPATWCLILDHYAKHTGYEPFTTTDLSGGQFTPAGDFKFPYPLRHGAVLRLTAREYAHLQQSFGK